MVNSFESAAREKKAARLVLALGDLARQLGTTEAILARHLTAKQWVKLAVLAGQHPPSDTTIARVRELVAARESRGELIESLVEDTEPMASGERDNRAADWEVIQ
jgi:hypothetical protein